MFNLRIFSFIFLVCLFHQDLIKGTSTITEVIDKIIPNKEPDAAEVQTLNTEALKIKYKDTQKALELAKNGLRISQKINYTEGISESNLLLGEIYQVIANYEKALDYYLSANKGFEKLNYMGGIALVSNNIGKIYELTGNYDLAVAFYKKALELNKELHNVNEIASNYNNLGKTYVLSDSIDKGLSYYLVAYMIADSLNNTQEKIQLLNNIGNGFLELKKVKQALGNFELELQLSKNENNNFAIARSLFNIGHAYYQTGDYVSSLKNITESINIAEKANFLGILQESEYILSQVYAATGNFEAAFMHHTLYKKYSDSIFSEEKSKQLAEVQVKYELESKEQENQLLRLQNAESKSKITRKNYIIFISSLLSLIFISLVLLLFRVNRRFKALNTKLTEQGEKLRELNQQKDRFFSFVVHNLNNPFHTVWGFSELMLKHADEKDMERMVRYSKYIYDSSSGIKQILENLQEWTRLQHGNYEYNPVRIELESLIKDTLEVNSRRAGEKNITLHCENVENKYAYADRLAIYTVLQNLISNAINFTPSLGKVTISARYAGRFVEIAVTDNGAGLSEDDINHLFKLDVSPSSVGIKNSKGAGMGLILSREMVTKNGGEIRVESNPGGGSRFTFSLPIPDDEMEYSEQNEGGLDSFIIRIKQGLLKEKKLSDEFLKEMNLLLPLHEYLSKAISVEDLKEFSQSIIKHSELHHVESMNLYGKKLFTYAEKLQFDKIFRILPEFPDLIKKTEVNTE